jgi:N-acetylmuramoyl-L-alanine amidase
MLAMFHHTDARRNFLAISLTAGAALCLAAIPAQPSAAGAEPTANTLNLVLRDRVPSAKDATLFQVRERPQRWEAKKTAVIICDMWDLHHCKRAVERVQEMAPRMNEVIAKAREQGVFIIHAPSSCMAAYENTPMRQRAKNAPKAKNLPKDIGSWCNQIPTEEKGRYPIDQTDSEDDEKEEHAQWAAKLTALGRNPKAPWKSEYDVLKMDERDAVSDSGVEIWNLLEERGIDNVILMGVHTNMCVLGRPFGLRQMAKNGKNVVLMRDMTDTMYNPLRWPYVNHFRGTDLIVEHVEKYVCPSITSDQVLGDKPFRFKEDLAAETAPLPLKGAILVVDPGHGGQGYSKSYTGGTQGRTSRLTESELNLRVSKELAKLLQEKGATVYLTREANHRLSREGSKDGDELHARIDFFEHYQIHFFLSVHHNAGGPDATGHTTLYKLNAKDSTLYESLAQTINDALEGAVPGPKAPLFKRSIHILRETSIPGMISEAGFMTNRAFDELSMKPDYPKTEAEALCKGAVKYWTDHKDTLIDLREKLIKERAEHPRDPKTYTAIDLNPDFQARMKKLLAQIAPDGKYDPAKIGDYVENFKKVVVTDPKVTFTVKGEFDGKQIKLSGETSERKYHDQLIDLLVAMKLYDISNGIKLPR